MNPTLALHLPSGPELLIIFFVILLVFGAKKLPELARGMGSAVNEFRKAKDDFDAHLHNSAPNPPPTSQVVQPAPERQPYGQSPYQAPPPAATLPPAAAPAPQSAPSVPPAH